MARIKKKLAIPQMAKDAEQLVHSPVAGGNVKWYHFGNSLAVSYEVQHTLRIHLTTQMHLKNKLSERSQTQKKHAMYDSISIKFLR